MCHSTRVEVRTVLWDPWSHALFAFMWLQGSRAQVWKLAEKLPLPIHCAIFPALLCIQFLSPKGPCALQVSRAQTAFRRGPALHQRRVRVQFFSPCLYFSPFQVPKMTFLVAKRCVEPPPPPFLPTFYSSGLHFFLFSLSQAWATSPPASASPGPGSQKYESP